MWKQGGSSATLERAQAALSSRRGRGTSGAPRPAQLISSQELSVELLSSHSGSSLSSVRAHRELQSGTGHVPKSKSDPAPEVGRPFSSLDSGANRFLKKTAATQGHPEERAVSSSLRTSQTAALSRLAQVENRFGKGVQKRSPSSVGHMSVQDVPEEQTVLAQPGSDLPRRFVKSRPQGALRGNGLLVLSDSSEHGAQECNSRQQLQSPAHFSTTSPRVTSPVRDQTPLKLSPSPLSPTPSPPELSPCPLSPTPSPPELSPSLPGRLSSSAGSARVDVHSLEELFPLDDASDDTSEPSQDLQINVMDIDELEPAALQMEEHAKKAAQVDLPEDSQEEPGEEDYPSDFESVIQTESLSEHIQDGSRSPSPPHSEPTRGNAQLPSPPCSEHIQDGTRSPSPPHSELTQDSVQSLSPPRSERSYSKTFTSGTPEARSPEAPVSDTPLPRSQLRFVKDKPRQTSHQPAHYVYSPSLQLLMQSLRQQLALTSQFISSSREHHARILQNLGPPNYTYTTLEDTQENIWKLRASMRHSKQQTGKR